MDQNGHSISETFRIRPLEAGSDNRLRVSTLTDLIQQAAWIHAVKLGVGTPAMIEKGLTWMLSRLQIRIKQFPAYPGEVRIETWPSGTDRLFTFRHFLVTDGNGTICAQARSAWMVVDLSRKRAISPPDFIRDLPHRPEPDDTELYRLRFSVPERLTLHSDIYVRAQDIDINEHVNNNMIIQWLFECLDKPGRLTLLDVLFKSECYRGDYLQSGAAAEMNGYLHRIIRPADNQVIALAQTAYD